MPFHSNLSFEKIPFANIAIQATLSFAFWFVVAWAMGGDRWAPASLGAVISAGNAIVKGAQPRGTLPDAFGSITYSGGSVGYTRASQGFDPMRMAMSAGITFAVWLVVGYFIIRGSAWKYASVAAIIAAVGSFL